MKKIMTKEARLPVMWAIDFRDMHSGIHGLYYAKDRKLVEEFYEALKSVLDERNPEYADDPDLREMDYQTIWDEFYSRGIQQIEEINFRDIGKLPSGKYGIIVDGVEYRLVNNVSIDLYEESTNRCRKMKFRRIVKESSSELKMFRKAIEIAKRKIMRDVKRNGIKENQGANELRELQDMLLDIHLDRNKTCNGDEEQLMRDMLDNFDDWASTYTGEIVKESYDDGWRSVGAAFDEWVQRLWKYTRQDRDNRMEAFQDCTKACEKAMKDYYDTIVATDESTEKPVEESTADNDGEPRIYVGTYAKYNNGSLDGKWVDLMQFDTYEEFVDYCRELHKDEKDPEFMVQDYENYPEKWYHEGGLPTEEEFDKITEFYMMDGDRKAAYEAYVNHTGDDDMEHFQEAYQGKFSSAEDFAYDLVDGIGWDGVGKENLEMYFDYDSFGRDLMYDFHRGDEDNEDAEGNPEDPDKYYDNEGYEMGEYESDDQVARDYIDNLGGVDQLGQETAQRYFDYDSFGRDLLINDYFEEDGYVFLRM